MWSNVLTEAFSSKNFSSCVGFVSLPSTSLSSGLGTTSEKKGSEEGSSGGASANRL